jgi:hypothetical protein
MSFQGVVSPREALDVLLEIEGTNLVGTGNSLTMFESVTKFGADATRLSLADAGDGIEDAILRKRRRMRIFREFTRLAVELDSGPPGDICY